MSIHDFGTAIYAITEKGEIVMPNSFSYEPLHQTLVVHLPKDLDHHNCRDLKYETDLLLAENYITHVIFDFTRTEFMDSSGIGILLNRYKQMDRSGGRVTIYGASAQIRRILKIGGIAGLMTVVDTREAAITG